MSFNKTVNQQLKLHNWINQNITSVRKFNYSYSSSLLLRYVQRDIPDATHENFKQAMIGSGYFADTSYCNEHYNKWFFNVSDKSITELRKRIDRRTQN